MPRAPGICLATWQPPRKRPKCPKTAVAQALTTVFEAPQSAPSAPRGWYLDALNIRGWYADVLTILGCFPLQEVWVAPLPSREAFLPLASGALKVGKFPSSPQAVWAAVLVGDATHFDEKVSQGVVALITEPGRNFSGLVIEPFDLAEAGALGSEFVGEFFLGLELIACGYIFRVS